MVVVDQGVVCPLGIGIRQVSASFRAGLCSYRESPVIGRGGEPITLSLVPEAGLPPIAAGLSAQPLSDRQRRLVRLSGMALQQAAGPDGVALPVFLALPDAHPGVPAAPEVPWFDLLAEQAGVPIDRARSQLFPLGRAAGFFALQAAAAALASGQREVWVGGVDSYLDLPLLCALDGERRLLGTGAMDGFAGGEAAAFVRLAAVPPGTPATQRSHTQVSAVGTARDPGHRYSAEPGLGAGLSAALQDMLAAEPSLPAFRTCLAGINGERFGSKAWGVAHLRHAPRFDPDLAFEHPADGFGDVGAAMGPLLLSLAGDLLRNGLCEGPVLLWASSDLAPCGCACVEAT